MAAKDLIGGSQTPTEVLQPCCQSVDSLTILSNVTTQSDLMQTQAGGRLNVPLLLGWEGKPA